MDAKLIHDMSNPLTIAHGMIGIALSHLESGDVQNAVNKLQKSILALDKLKIILQAERAKLPNTLKAEV